MAEIRNLSIGEHALIGDIIGESFADDPINHWIFRSKRGITDYYTLVAKKLYLPQGYGHILDDGSSGTLWLPPHVKKHIPLWKSIDIALSMTRHGGVKSILRGTSVDDSLAAYKPTKPHYFLFAIGTRPPQQNKGLGSKLMEVGLKQADKEGMPAYLESSKESNLHFYRKFGFEVTEKIKPTPDCPPMWLMWRNPR